MTTTASTTTASTTTASITTASTTTAPIADSRALGLAHYAARGVLEHVLARHGITFQQQIALRAAVTADTPQTPDHLVTHVLGSLKADPVDIRATLDELLAKQLLVADGAHLRPTDAGRELIAAVGAEIAPITARIWGGIPAEDLAAAGRVLALVTERANAEFAALTA
ncbi:MarR family transcriptional regulator [Streptomyces sp. PSKA54]|uniref:MarR family transcriptional regulator n=1 Tax=Streptomyces himalayensis subsp. aureolus TaxID=2758039 RepID=A0A7W2HJU7_9ACTN|nr:MarR family transcriptional regulator [Streptomyces himalayensis]MBA4866505.1 MarR family transcriptional regulator [Streptomyces himalayensis subsp. aureolus]